MIILIDQDVMPDGTIAANHWFHTDDDAKPNIAHPTEQGKLLNSKDLLSLCSDNTDLQKQCGFDIVSQLPHETEPKSRWQRVLDAMNHPDAPDDLRKLKLK